ncbi:MAG: FAD-dependent monooxygenase [Rhizobiaceae bacterium]
MSESRSRQVIIAGAGVAGLIAAVAFARKGFSVRVYEKSPQLDEIGAGVQLSPNATRLLASLDLLEPVLPAASFPSAVVLRSGRRRSLKDLARVPLGEAAERRWGSPYVVIHRADLQSALIAQAVREGDVTITTGAAVRDMAVHSMGVTASIDLDGRIIEAKGLLLIGADGVWSSIRALAGETGRSRPSGRIAWRATIPVDGPQAATLAEIGATRDVTAFLLPNAHLVCYPIRGGRAVNLVAITQGEVAPGWGGNPDPYALRSAFGRAAPRLKTLIDDVTNWTAWPLHTVEPTIPWTIPGGVALIGDAAHAMMPYAAQGAAMAIEDAVRLADHVAGAPSDLGKALAAWDAERRPRILKVVKRGALNERAWHARGLTALGRNIVLGSRSPERLAGDLDWLYGWRPPAEPA